MPAHPGHSVCRVQQARAPGETVTSANTTIAAAVAIDPAPFRSVLPLPVSSLKSASPVLGNPANRGKAIALTFERFRFGWANALPEDEARTLHDEYHVAASGVPLFQAATANLNPWTEAGVDTRTEQRGPLLIVAGAADTTVPLAITRAMAKVESRNAGVTELIEVPDRGHSLTIDHGWAEVADISVDFLHTQLSAVRPE